MIEKTVEKIKKASSILLTTHRQCDGDGLGSQLGLYYALKKIGKKVRVLNVDGTPRKYSYLNPDEHIQYFDGQFDPVEKTDLALIFDTNDRRLVEPLYKELENQCSEIVFVDHHPILKSGPAPTSESWINIKAASTGELAYDLVMALEIPLDADIARSIYTSIVFDTQLFRYVRNSPRSHEIAAELLKHEKDPSLIHKSLFGNFTAPKLKFLAETLANIEFYFHEQLAILLIRSQNLKDLGLDIYDSRDVIDMVMNIESVEAAALFREDGPNSYKLSLRSKGKFPVSETAEKLGGGGHPFASGASIRGDYAKLKDQVVEDLGQRIEGSVA